MSDFIELPRNNRSNSFRKTVCGVGVNDANYIVLTRDDTGKKKMCPFYDTWKAMLNRCYSSKTHSRQPTYQKCTVDEEWLAFSVFREWMERQDWKGKSLDKDIKVIGNKIYGPETCLFVDSSINNIIINNKASRGLYPLGVYRKKGRDVFTATFTRNSKKIHIGTYKTAEKASHEYKKHKKKHIEQVAILPENEHIREYLLNHAALLD